MGNKLHPSVELAWVGLVRAERSVVEAVEAEVAAQDLPPLAWYDVLLELSRRPDRRLRQGDLQARMLFAQYNLSRLLDRLERAGLVRREACPTDARSKWVVATPEGIALRERVWPSYAAAIERHLGSKLTPDEAATLAALLGKLIGR
jgi:DNA-binding MarR family transcriptional regulator